MFGSLTNDGADFANDAHERLFQFHRELVLGHHLAAGGSSFPPTHQSTFPRLAHPSTSLPKMLWPQKPFGSARSSWSSLRHRRARCPSPEPVGVRREQSGAAAAAGHLKLTTGSPQPFGARWSSLQLNPRLTEAIWIRPELIETNERLIAAIRNY